MSAADRRAWERYQRELVRQQRAWEREQRELEHQLAEEDAALRTEKVNEQVRQLEGLLGERVQQPLVLDFEALKAPWPQFDPGQDGTPTPPPDPHSFAPPRQSVLRRLLPGAKRRDQLLRQQAEAAHRQAYEQWQAWEQGRQYRLALAQEQYNQQVAEVQQQHARIEELKADYASGKRAAVEQVLSATLARSSYPAGFPHNAALIHRRREKELLVEYEFPLADDIIPADVSYRYVRSRGEITAKKRSATDKNRLYKSVLAQTTIRTLYELFQIDQAQHVERIAFNGVVQGFDPTTGRPSRPKLVSVRVGREEFLDRDFTRIDPQKTLQSLKANFSPAPTELEPIPPVLEFDVNDPRFIDEEEILSSLDERINLIDLTPSAFETLIRDLFQAMGFDTYKTTPSRDGGVDCVAYYQKSVVGGKYIIQAKKYTNVVPVEAVRDLAGALDHERASKGILVTTSDFTKAGREFARDKPIELINGNQLLALIKENTGQEMKIVLPPKKRGQASI